MEQQKIINNSCSIELAVNKQRIRNNGTVRLYLRIAVENHRAKFVKLRYYWPAELFDPVKKTIKPQQEGDRQYLTFLSTIETEKAKYWKVVQNKILRDEYFTPDDIIDGVNILMFGENLAAFIEQMSKRRERDRELKNQSGRHHRSTANMIMEFTKQKDIPIDKVTKAWCDKFLTWLMTNRIYSSASVHIKNMKTYLRIASKLNITVHSSIEHYTIPRPIYDTVWLDRDEVDKLLNLYFAKTTIEENRLCIQCFLFSCFTGLRISDLKRFDLSWIQNNEMVFTPVKQKITSKQVKTVRIPLIPMAMKFLEDLGDTEKLVKRSEQRLNSRLKVIAELVGINKKITTHVARHTFATQLAINNTPISVIANLMGHASIKSTQQYIHIAEQVRKKEMDRLQATFSNYKMKVVG